MLHHFKRICTFFLIIVYLFLFGFFFLLLMKKKRTGTKKRRPSQAGGSDVMIMVPSFTKAVMGTLIDWLSVRSLCRTHTVGISRCMRQSPAVTIATAYSSCRRW